jgi:beta-lactamase class A
MVVSPMQSVYKAPIGMAVLHEVDAGRLSLDAPIRVEAADLVPSGMHSPLRDAHPKGGVVPLRELLRLSVEESDGTASDVLLRLVGGKAKAQGYLSSLGVEGIRIETTEGEMGRDYQAQYRSWAMPGSSVDWLTALQQGKDLSPQSRALLLGWMTATKTFPTRLKGRLPAGHGGRAQDRLLRLTRMASAPPRTTSGSSRFRTDDIWPSRSSCVTRRRTRKRGMPRSRRWRERRGMKATKTK